MRLALCLSGFPRDITNSYKWLDWSILSVLRENNISYDFFLSLWESEEFPIKDGLILDLFNPITFEIEEWDDKKRDELGWKQLKKYSNVQRPSLLGMFYKIFKCDELRRKYESENNLNYDVIFRLRSELNFTTKLDVKELEDVVNNTDKKIVYLPLVPNWTKDTLAFGNNTSMSLYCYLFNHLLELNQHFKSSTAEILLRKWLDLNKIKCYNTSLNYKLRGKII